jgi:hypothetical protein
MKPWQVELNPDGFIKRVENPVKLPSVDDLERCVKGLTKRIKDTTSYRDKMRLSIIRTELMSLIDVM